MPPIIIVIDKRPFLPDALEMIISHYFPEQFTILAFSNTTSAFNVIEELTLKKESIDLIICDARMPNLAGFEFLNIINTISPTSTKVLTTTYINLNDYKEMLSNPTIDFVLEKPFKTNSLINIIKCTIRQQSTLAQSRKNNDTIHTLKNSLSILRGKYQIREQTLLSISYSLNAFYFKVNLKNSFLDIYANSDTIFGYETSSFKDFDSFLSIVTPNDKAKVVKSIKKIKVMLATQDKVFFNITSKSGESSLVKAFLIAEEVDSVTGTESIIGFVQNISSEIEEYSHIKNS